MQGKRVYRSYDREFKENAVQLAVKGDRPIAAIARDPGIHTNVLYSWIKKYEKDKEGAFKNDRPVSAEEMEWKALKKRLYDVEEENAILKKALAIFSKGSK